MEAPGHDQHRDGKNVWALQHATEDQQRFKVEELFEAGALLLGRVTYQIFAAFWPTAPKDEGFAHRMNSIPKYVVSRSLKEARWNNSTIIDASPAESISKLKRDVGGDIMLNGSADLLNSLIRTDIIDEYRIMVFPVVLGSGKHLFRDESDTSHLRLADTRVFSSGTVLLTYRPTDESPTSKYVETFAWTREAIRSFQAAQNPDRVLATVLFTDIVDSTGQAATLGDARERVPVRQPQLLVRPDSRPVRRPERVGDRLTRPRRACWAEVDLHNPRGQ